MSLRTLFCIALIANVAAVPFAQAADDIATEFAAALEPALGTSAGSLDMYTVEEPQAFRIWSAVPPVIATYPCARNIALAVENKGAQLGVFWLGVCKLGDEVPDDLLATAVANARAATADPLIQPAAAGLGELVRQRQLEAGTRLVEDTVLMRHDAAVNVLRTVLVAPQGGREILVLQYEALRVCANGQAPLCSDPATTVDAMARRLLRLLDRPR